MNFLLHLTYEVSRHLAEKFIHIGKEETTRLKEIARHDKLLENQSSDIHDVTSILESIISLRKAIPERIKGKYSLFFLVDATGLIWVAIPKEFKKNHRDLVIRICLKHGKIDLIKDILPPAVVYEIP